jgi:preprotein translocase subunit SecA
VLKDIASDWAKTTLAKMGLNEDEAIESPMVSRRIRATQQRIEDRALGTVYAASAAEWLDKNCPELF